MIQILSFVFLIPGIILGSIGSLFLKKGSKKFTLNLKKLIRNKEIIFGLLLFITSTAFYVPALKFGNLSIVYPLTSLSYVIISLLSVKYLGEKMNHFKWIGIIFIIIGSFLIIN